MNVTGIGGGPEMPVGPAAALVEAAEGTSVDRFVTARSEAPAVYSRQAFAKAAGVPPTFVAPSSAAWGPTMPPALLAAGQPAAQVSAEARTFSRPDELWWRSARTVRPEA